MEFNLINNKIEINVIITVIDKNYNIKTEVHQCHECGRLMLEHFCTSDSYHYCYICYTKQVDLKLYTIDREFLLKRLTQENKEQKIILKDLESKPFQLLRLDNYYYWDITSKKHNKTYLEALNSVNNFILKLKQELKKYKIDSQDYKEGCHFIKTYEGLKEILIYNKESWNA